MSYNVLSNWGRHLDPSKCLGKLLIMETTFNTGQHFVVIEIFNFDIKRALVIVVVHLHYIVRKVKYFRCLFETFELM